MRHLLDTSAVAKLYHAEKGSDYVQRLLVSNGEAALISRLGVLEMHSVLAGKLRSGEISEQALHLARERLQSDIAKRRYRVIAVRAQHYQEAESLIGKWGQRGLRTLDALQLAVALDLHRNGLIDAFVTADRVLCRVAPAAGCKTIDPEGPGEEL